MQQPVIPRVRAPSDLTQTSMAIVIGNQVYGVPAIELGSAFGFQPLDADLTSWAAITRATGFDTFVATPSSANLRSLLTDETGTGAAVFADAPTISGTAVFSGVPSLTGGGLAFPATQVPSAGANTLDDYEEGTFTPSFAATGSTFSYSLRSGAYTKIGRMVYFDIAIILNTSGNTLTTNALTITGLPFTSAGGAGIFPVRWGVSTTAYIMVVGRVSGTTVVLESWTAATTGGTNPTADGLLHATNGAGVRIIGSYYV